MAGFNYERDLPHQNEAINAVIKALIGREIKTNLNAEQNPLIESKDKIFDICMQTGTGKTYTFMKMMFELITRLTFFVKKFLIFNLNVKNEIFHPSNSISIS